MEIDSINIEGLHKYYDKFIALEDINLSIKKGEIFGIIGANGNGKSTLLNCMTGVLNYERGKVFVDGIDLKKKPLVVKSKMAYCTDECNAYEIMTGEEYLSFVASVYKVDDSEFINKYNELIEAFNMKQHMNKLIKFYSHGTKQKIVLMAALIHNPQVWILDEPLIGLDAQSIKVLLGYFKSFKKSGKTVVVTIHDIDTAIKVCDRLILIKEGHVIKEFNNLKSDRSIKGRITRAMNGELMETVEDVQ